MTGHQDFSSKSLFSAICLWDLGFWGKIRDFRCLPLISAIWGLKKPDSREFLDLASGFLGEIAVFRSLPLGSAISWKIRDFRSLPLISAISGLKKPDSRDFLDRASGFLRKIAVFPLFAFDFCDFLENQGFPLFAFSICDFGAQKDRFSGIPGPGIRISQENRCFPALCL